MSLVDNTQTETHQLPAPSVAEDIREDTDIDAGYYMHREKLGEGGFSKVRLATHLLTGAKVAIKCMDKQKLGEDLFRVQTEIKALKMLDHQNIAKLLQVIQNEKNIYLVLEYCSGGELFDYIVAKSRLNEAESRIIMKKLLQCLGYLHASGFAHRDLKPENILFDQHHNIKLIDFGLAAHSKESSSLAHLQTCCGSPAYAAPELIAGNVYSGPAVDVWSAGIILYALLVGQLPFDDNNITVLYKKIQSGKYSLPVWLSGESKALINSMLQINPKKRSTVAQLLRDPWLNKGTEIPNYLISVQKGRLDEELLWDLHKYFPATPFTQLKHSILTKFGYHTATYWLLKELAKKQSIAAKGRKEELVDEKSNLLQMSKLNRSMDSILNEIKVDLAKSTPKPVVTKFGFIGTPEQKPKLVAVKRKIIPSEDGGKAADNGVTPSKRAENEMLCKTPDKCIDPSSKIPVPIKSPLRPINAKVIPINTPPPLPFKKRRMFEQRLNQTTGKTTVPTRYAEYSNDSCKTPLKQLESRPTPKKSLLKRILETATPANSSSVKSSAPRNITGSALTTTKNITMTGFQDPNECAQQVMQSLAAKGIECKQKGFMIRCSMNNKFQNVLTFNLEICTFGEKCAIQRKRLKGDSWNYKRICEEILRISNQSTAR